jgi:hypothetical protein
MAMGAGELPPALPSSHQSMKQVDQMVGFTLV